jgi:hypothetical protein
MNGQGAQQANSELGIIQELIDEHLRADCTLVQIDAHTWAIHGTIAVDSNVILAEFSNQEDAQTAIEQLSAAEHRAAGTSRRSCFS